MLLSGPHGRRRKPHIKGGNHASPILLGMLQESGKFCGTPTPAQSEHVVPQVVITNVYHLARLNLADLIRRRRTTRSCTMYRGL